MLIKNEKNVHLLSSRPFYSAFIFFYVHIHMQILREVGYKNYGVKFIMKFFWGS